MAKRLIGEGRESVRRVDFAVRFVESKRRLVNVAMQVFAAGLVPHAEETALEQCPHGFGGVDVDVVRADVLAGAVLDVVVFVASQAGVAAVLVGVDLRVGFDMPVNRGVQGGLVGRGKRHRDRLPAAPAHPEHRLFALRSAAWMSLLARVLVLLLPANVDLLHFDDTAQHPGIVAARFAEPAQHEPGGLLRNADLLRELHRGNALAGRDDQVYREDPLVQRDMGPLENGPGSHGESAVAVAAAVVAEPLPAASRDADVAAAVRAHNVSVPSALFEVDSGGLRVREHLKQLEGADGDVVVHGPLLSCCGPYCVVI